MATSRQCWKRENKHLYDGDIFKECPYCRAETYGLKSPYILGSLYELMTDEGKREAAKNILNGVGQ